MTETVVHIHRQWRRSTSNVGGDIPSLSLPFPFPPPFPPSLSLPFPSLPLPALPFPHPSPLFTAKGSGGALELPQRVRAEPGRQTHFGAFWFKITTLIFMRLITVRVTVFSARELMFMVAICRRPSVCRLSVTFVHPTQPTENFRQCFCAI